MKTSFNLITVSILASVCFAACAVKKSDKLKGGEKAGAEKPAAVCVAGQPGVVQIQGAVVAGEGAEAKVDERLKPTVVAGWEADGAAGKTSKEITPKVNSAISVENTLATLTENRSFINIGCPDQGEATKDMTKVALAAQKDFNVNKVGKIFVCGTAQLPAAMVTSLEADTIVLQDADLTITENFPGELNLIANTLELKGASRVRVVGKQQVIGNNQVAAKLSVVIAKEILGEGTLSVLSQGGSCSQPKAEEKELPPNFDTMGQ